MDFLQSRRRVETFDIAAGLFIVGAVKIRYRKAIRNHKYTGGIITAKDSNWLMSYTLNRQPHFKEQPKGQLVVWVYGPFTDVPGNYVKKPMRECTGEEITQEWLYHIGVPESEIIYDGVFRKEGNGGGLHAAER